MRETPILVLGGMGKTGRRVAHQLAERGRSVKIASRSGRQRFDWHDASTWAPAVDGVEAACGGLAGCGRAYLSDGVQQVPDREPRDFSAYVAATVPTGIWSP